MSLLQPKTFEEAKRLATAAGHDAASRQMRKNCRKGWNDEDYDLAVATQRQVLRGLGYNAFVDMIEADEAA